MGLADGAVNFESVVLVSSFAPVHEDAANDPLRKVMTMGATPTAPRSKRLRLKLGVFSAVESSAGLLLGSGEWDVVMSSTGFPLFICCCSCNNVAKKIARRQINNRAIQMFLDATISSNFFASWMAALFN
jgi:hypothetical protein